MSEYQYYEFLALDRPLTGEQRAGLRSISTRAEITATRFVSEYQWGDLRADPRTMMERYFDAFLYLANWGTRRLMFRLHRGVLDPETAGRYCCTDTASLIETGSHLILSLYVDREPDDYWEQPGGQLAAMVQARSELAAGDLRLLYLAWLLALQSDEVDKEDTEPPVPAGLGQLSASLQAIADFLEIDEDLIAVAAGTSPPVEEPCGLAEWVASLPAQKDALLARVATGEGAQLATRTEAAWEKAAELIETKRPRDYDLAVSLLRDLQALAERQEDPAGFRKRFLELRAQHQRKPSLLDRFDQAGLPS